ncbi:MAG: hypothetical protein AB7T63_05940 [Planctomycetota bacterium]
MSWIRYLVLVACVCAPCAAEEPASGLLAADARSRENAWALFRVVDEGTREPVAGVRVELHAERGRLLPERAQAAATGVTDEQGWLRLAAAGDPASPRPEWAYLLPSSHAPRGVSPVAVDGSDITLSPKRDVELEFHDPLGRPLANLDVSSMLGSGSTPDVQLTRTDARGLARLRDVSCRGGELVWFRGPGVLAGYGEIESPRSARHGIQRQLVRCEWGREIRGRVLRTDGERAAGVAVGIADRPRVHWTRTDDLGRFRVVGASATHWTADVLRVARSPGGGEMAVRVPPPGIERVIRLTDELDEDAGVPDDPNLAVRFDLLRGSFETLAREGLDLGVVAVRTSDGWTSRPGWTPDRVQYLLRCPPGEYLVHAWLEDGWHVYPGVTLTHAPVTVADAGPTSVRVAMDAPRPLRLDVRALPEGVNLVLVGHGWSRQLDCCEAQDEGGVVMLHLPAQGEVFAVVEDSRVLTASGWPTQTFHRVPDSAYEPGADPVSMAAPPAIVLVGSTEHDDGAPVKTESPMGLWSPFTHGGPFRLDLGDVLEVPLRLEPRDDALLPREIDLRDFPRRDGVIDLGRVVFRKRPPPALRLKILDVEGRPDAGAVYVQRGDMHVEARCRVDGDAAGFVHVPTDSDALLQAGARVTVVPGPAGRSFVMPWRTTLEGPGPWSVRPPGGQLRISVEAPSGQAAIEGLRVEVDGVVVEPPRWEDDADPGVMDIRGLEPGRHVVCAWAEGFLGRRVVVDVKGDDVANVLVRLAPHDAR